MKTTLLLILLVATLKGQETMWTLGVEGGPSVATLWGAPSSFPQHQYRVAFSAGSFFQVRLSKHFYLRGGTGIERKGSVIHFPGIHPGIQPVGPDFRITQSLDYIVLPLLVRFSTGHKTQFFLNL